MVIKFWMLNLEYKFLLEKVGNFGENRGGYEWRKIFILNGEIVCNKDDICIIFNLVLMRFWVVL